MVAGFVVRGSWVLAYTSSKPRVTTQEIQATTDDLEHNMKKVIALCLAMCCLAVPAAALTVEEITQLKKNGVSDRTIELMVERENQDQRRSESEPRITRTTEAVTYSTGKPSSTPLSEQEQRDLDRAWKMLENMTVEIEKRKQ